MQRVAVVAWLGVGLWIGAGTPAVAGDPGALDVRFQWLVGHPGGGEKASVILLPGTVVMAGESAERTADRTLQAIGQLKDAYRLGNLEPENVAQVITLPPGKETALPTSVGSVRAHCVLVTFDDRQATLRLTLREGAKTLAEPTISVLRGGQSIVGTRDGEAAPYLFLLIQPISQSGAAASGREPRILKKVAPVYPREARQAGIQGRVLLRCVIGTDGSVRSVTPEKAADPALVRAATAAVRQWRYEPLRDERGRLVEATLTITVAFRLD